MDMEEIAPHIDDVARVLEGKVSRDDIEREMENYLNVYRVPLATAKKSIVKKYGGNLGGLGVGTSKTVADLKANEQSVDMLVRLVYVAPKIIEVQGEKRTIHSGILGDNSGTVGFTCWSDEFDYQKGDVLNVRNAYTKEFNGKVEVHFGNRTTVAKGEKDDMPPWTGPSGADAVAKKVGELREGDRGFELKAMVLDVEERNVKVQGVDKTVFSGVMGDASGKIQFSAWSDFGLKEGDVLGIRGGYVKSWRGIPQLSFDDRGDVEKLDGSGFPSKDEILASASITIEEMEERGGSVDALVNGIMIDVKDGSGLISRCPECNRVLQRNACRVHGEVKGEMDMRVKGVLDDGTGALTVILNRELTEQVLGKSMEECMEMAKESMDSEVVKDALVKAMLARPYSVRGNVTNDDFGLMLIAKEIGGRKVDVQAEARSLLGDLGVTP